MDFRSLAQMLGFVNPGADYPKNVPGQGDFVNAIKRGMQPKPKAPPSQDYPKRVKTTI